MKIMNFNISQRHIYLLIILVVAIVIFSNLSGTREGFNNYMSGNKNKHNKDDAEAVDVEVIEEGAGKVTTETVDGSYIAPAGNVVLYSIDESLLGNNNGNNDNHRYGNNEYGHKHNKHCRHKNSRRNTDDGPLGIPRSQIPQGDEDLYILKSNVVPPVCPACPNVTACPNNKEAPPCPPCARCPEPAFDCKKVPNYNSNNSEYLPRPVLADFSQFGM